MTTSTLSYRDSTASCIDKAESTGTKSTPLGTAKDVGALTKITLAPMRAACSAIAYPILPLERLPI